MADLTVTLAFKPDEKVKSALTQAIRDKVEEVTGDTEALAVSLMLYRNLVMVSSSL